MFNHEAHALVCRVRTNEQLAKYWCPDQVDARGATLLNKRTPADTIGGGAMPAADLWASSLPLPWLPRTPRLCLRLYRPWLRLGMHLLLRLRSLFWSPPS